MAIGWDDIMRLKRVEARAEKLGFKFTSNSVANAWIDISSGFATICLKPKDDSLPHYNRDARIYNGTLEGIEHWLNGVEWARSYDDLLKLSSDKKRDEKEQVERNRQLLKTIKTGKLAQGKLGGVGDEAVDEYDDEAEA